MGESRRRGKFRVIDGGRTPIRVPRLVTHTVLVEQGGHDAIESLRQVVGMDDAHDFDLFLIGAGLGAVETPMFIRAFSRYVQEIEKIRQGSPDVPRPTIQQFTGMMVKIGLGEVLRAAKEQIPVATDTAEIVKPEVSGEHAPGPPESAA